MRPKGLSFSSTDPLSHCLATFDERSPSQCSFIHSTFGKLMHKFQTTEMMPQQLDLERARFLQEWRKYCGVYAAVSAGHLGLSTLMHGLVQGRDQETQNRGRSTVDDSWPEDMCRRFLHILSLQAFWAHD